MKTVDVRKSLLSLKSQIDSCLEAITSGGYNPKERFLSRLTIFSNVMRKIFWNKGVTIDGFHENILTAGFNDMYDNIHKFKQEEIEDIVKHMEDLWHEAKDVADEDQKASLNELINVYRQQRSKFNDSVNKAKETAELRQSEHDRITMTILSLAIASLTLSGFVIFMIDGSPFRKMNDIMKNTYNTMINEIKNVNFSISKIISIIMLPIKYVMSVTYQTVREFPLVTVLLTMSGFLFIAAAGHRLLRPTI